MKNIPIMIDTKQQFDAEKQNVGAGWHFIIDLLAAEIARLQENSYLGLKSRLVCEKSELPLFLFELKQLKEKFGKLVINLSLIHI